MNILLIGPPGSGKGTQASYISSKYQIANISTGEILRNEIKIASKIGLLVKSIVNLGRLVPDEIVIEIIKKRILMDDCKNGFILDGFPRNMDQVYALNKMLDINKMNLDIALLFKIDDSIVAERLSKRIYCKNCDAVSSLSTNGNADTSCIICGSKLGFYSRSDDSFEVVIARIKSDKIASNKLYSYYQSNQKNTFFIDAAQNPRDIRVEIDSIIMSFNKK